MNLLTIKEFAQEIKVSEKTAYGMARSDAFVQNKISLDISASKEKRRGTIRRNRTWRIAIDRYYGALEKGAI